MNKEKRQKIIEQYQHWQTELYNSAWHEGRHECREKFANCGYLIIDPEKYDELFKIAKTDPCEFCKDYDPSYKRGCTKAHCDLKDKQSDALELIAWFKLK